jgi:DNA-directed RNA polymerase subunit M/transcription elongation factor TFIIS
MASACECHVLECDNCSESILVRDPINVGDSVVCPNCKKKSKIEEVTAGYRADKNKQTHDGESVGIF